jgi:hypothetical protein
MGGTAAEPTTGIVCCRARGGSDHAAYIDGACVLTDSDGDQIFSTFDTRLHGCVRSSMRTGLGQAHPLFFPVICIFSGIKTYS